MTTPCGKPDAVISTDHGPASVYASRNDTDAAIVGDGFALVIPESEVTHLVHAIAPDEDYVDPDEPTADDIRDAAHDIAHDLEAAIQYATGKACEPDDWDGDSVAELHGILTDLLRKLDDIHFDLRAL